MFTTVISPYIILQKVKHATFSKFFGFLKLLHSLFDLLVRNLALALLLIVKV